MKKRRVLFGLFAIACAMIPILAGYQENSWQSKILPLTVYIDEKEIVLDGCRIIISRPHGFVSEMSGYASFEELEAVIRSNPSKKNVIQANSKLNEMQESNSLYDFFWYKPNEEKDPVDFSQLKLSDHRNEILLIERESSLLDPEVTIFQQFALYVE